jgi:NOL1/NOP2/sun family putative RNA methylase
MKHNYLPKPLFLERMKLLLPDEKDFNAYLEILKKEPVRSIRCNTLKISPESLKKKLEEKGWKIKIPFKNYPEIMFVENELQPGELGRSFEHLLGYYYIQETASMLPPLVLNPKPEERILDLCASPGSKTTQIAAKMENSGLIIANEVKIGRIKILASNLERCGVANSIITKKDGIALCKRFKEQNFLFDKILLDAPCSGEGTIRSTPKTFEMWNIKTIENLSKLQKSLIASAIEILKPGGELVYSTCTHAPEENEEILDFALRNFDVKIEKKSLPLKTVSGISKWQDKEYLEDVKYSCRVYPQNADTEGFFIAKIKKSGERNENQ